MHVSIEQSVNVEAVDIIATSPATSPDTNGIHVTSSENVHIIGPVIQTGKIIIIIIIVEFMVSSDQFSWYLDALICFVG